MTQRIRGVPVSISPDIPFGGPARKSIEAALLKVLRALPGDPWEVELAVSDADAEPRAWILRITGPTFWSVRVIRRDHRSPDGVLRCVRRAVTVRGARGITRAPSPPLR